MSVISIIVSSNNLMHREAIKNILNKASTVFKVLDAVETSRIVERAVDLQPEIILVKDRAITVELLRDIKSACPHTVLVVVADQAVETVVAEAILAGADACIGSLAPGYLPRILELVSRGDILVFPRMMKNCLQKKMVATEQKVPALAEELTAKEKEVYSLLIKRHSNKEIASRLFISESTVKTHVRNVLNKMGVRNRASLMDIIQSEYRM